MKCFRICFFIYSICFVCTLNAQNASSKIYPYTFKQDEMYNNCEMDKDVQMGLEPSGRVNLSKQKNKTVGMLTIRCLSFTDDSLIKWANSIKGRIDEGSVTIILSNNEKITRPCMLKDIRIDDMKGTQFGALLIGFPLNSESDYEKISKYNIKSIQYLGSTFDISTRMFESAPTLASMYETLKKY